MNRLRASLLAAVALAAVIGLFGGVSGAEASHRRHMSFTPGERSRPAVHPRSYRRATGGGRHGSRHGGHAAPPRGRGRVDEGEGAAVPGAGFTMENGVLTYPAPARFQPRNLKHP